MAVSHHVEFLSVKLWGKVGWFFGDELDSQKRDANSIRRESSCYQWGGLQKCFSWDKSVKYDRPGECGPEKDCLWWHWLRCRQREQKASSESSELWIDSRWYKSLAIDLISLQNDGVVGCLPVKPCCWAVKSENVIGAFWSIFCQSNVRWSIVSKNSRFVYRLCVFLTSSINRL